MRRVTASLFDATRIALRGAVTSVGLDEVQVTCTGPWGEVIFEIDPTRFEETEGSTDAPGWPNIGDEVEVVLMGLRR